MSQNGSYCGFDDNGKAVAEEKCILLASLTK
jgi:hypothetical protein